MMKNKPSLVMIWILTAAIIGLLLFAYFAGCWFGQHPGALLMAIALALVIGGYFAAKQI